MVQGDLKKAHTIGARVRVNCPGSIAHKRETTVTGELRRFATDNDDDGRIGYWGQEVDILQNPNKPRSKKRLAFEYHELVRV